MKNRAIALFVVILVLIVTFSYRLIFTNTSSIVKNELLYAKAPSYKLAQLLAKNYPHKKVLVIKNSESLNSARINAVHDGLEDGFDNIMDKVKYDTPLVQLPYSVADEDKDCAESLDLENFMTGEDFNRLLSHNKNYDIVISTLGLPRDLSNIDLFKSSYVTSKKHPITAVISSDLSLLLLVDAGMLSYLVIPKPEFKLDNAGDFDNLDDLFDKAYLLVSKDNVKSVLEDYQKYINVTF